MTERSSDPDRVAARARVSADSREARLKAALKANIARRKAQARARSGAAPDRDQDKAPDAESGNEAG